MSCGSAAAPNKKLAACDGSKCQAHTLFIRLHQDDAWGSQRVYTWRKPDNLKELPGKEAAHSFLTCLSISGTELSHC